MIFLLLLIAFVLGMGAGGYIVYKYEEKTITELTKRCAEASKRLETLIKDEELFIANMHHMPDDYVPMQGDDLIDYLRAKYMNEEHEKTECGEDESDNLYV